MCRNGVETDLYALLDSSRQGVLRALADNLGGQFRILLEGPDLTSLDAPAAEFKAYVNPCAQTEPGSITNKIAALAPRSGGLLTDETRAQLLAGDYAAVATKSAREIRSVRPRLVSRKLDPYQLAADYLGYLLDYLPSRLGRGWSFREGDLVLEQQGGRCYRLLVFDGFKMSDSAFICDLVERVHAFNAAAQKRGPPVKAYMGGAPFHTALATERSKRQIGILSVVSVVVVLALGVWLFRSARFVVPLVATLASAFLVAAAALFAVWGRPHVLTFVFGTTLIGLGVDYVYHACAAEDMRTVRRPLACALATTLACFVPLTFSSVTVLRQMALFTGVGLLTAWAAVMVWFGRAGARPSPGGSGVPPLQGRDKRDPPVLGSGVPPLQRVVMLLVLLAVGAGAFRIRFSSDPALFYRADPFLEEGERKLHDLNKAAASQLVVVEGATLQEALEREEAAGVKGLSAIIPSLKRQRENQALAAGLRGQREFEATLSKLTSAEYVRRVRDFPDTRGLLAPDEIADPLLEKLIRSTCVKADGRVLLVSPFDARIGEAPPGVRGVGVTLIEPKRELTEMFDSYAREAYRLLGISFILLVALLALLFRRRFLACAGPVLAAAVATLGVLGWCGVQLTFFHALCFFICTGLGLDYAIFHLEVATSATLPNQTVATSAPHPSMRRVVFVSFLTSAAAFGMLAFTPFPVTRAMGTALALGLFFVYLFSSCMGRCVCGKLSATHEEKR